MLVSKKEILVSIYKKNKIVLIGLKIRLNDNDNLSPFFQIKTSLLLLFFWQILRNLLDIMFPKDYF